MQIIVLGMHRSGTSAITRLVNMMGAYIGPENLIGQPALDNLKGFWERHDVRTLNDKILKALGGNWCHYVEPDIEKLSDSDLEIFKKLAKTIVFNLDTHRPWVLKDPRLCLLFPFWRTLLEVPICLIVYRPPLDVAFSIKRRNQFPLSVGIALWEFYQRHALMASEGLPRILVRYADLIKDPVMETTRLYTALEDFGARGLRLPSEREIRAFIDSALQHECADIEAYYERLNAQQQELVRRFENGTVLNTSNTTAELSANAHELLVIATDLDTARVDLDTTRADLDTTRADLDTARADLNTARADNLSSIALVLKEKDERNSIELNQLKLTQSNLEDRLHYLEHREVELTRWINALLSSVSWKITAPLRAIVNLANWLTLRKNDVKDAYKKGGTLNIVTHTWSYFSTRLFGTKPVRHPTLQHNSTIIELPNNLQSLPLHLLGNNITPQTVSQVISAQLDIVCFANIEWSARYQRPQHLMSQFAKNGYRVFYIIASKHPPANVNYMIDEVAKNIYEICLHVGFIQNFYDEMMEHQNQFDFLNSLAKLIEDYRIKTALLVVHLPYWTPLALELRNRYGWKILYDCMDEWIDFPNIGKALIEQEEILVRQSNLVTVTASLLYDKWSPVARHCVLIRNAVDYKFFREHCSPNPLLDDMARPIIGYYGALAEWVDFELLSFLAKARPNWNLVLIGDVFVNDIAGLDKMQNVFLLGRRPYTDMPRFLYHFDVCLIPFKLNNVTHAVDPVKFYEFVSAGKPIVSVPLKELKIYDDYIYFANQPEDFLRQIEISLVENDFDSFNKRIELAKQNDWSNRFDTVLSSIDELYKRASFIIVTYNNCNLTHLCVESIFRNTTYPNYEVILVDNASSDDTRNYLRYLSRTSDRIKVILNDKNFGFAKANNQGLKIATGEFLVLLNNDTVVPRGWFDPLLRHLENPTIGLVGPVTNFVGNEAKIDIDYQTLDEMEFFADRYTSTHAGKTFDIMVLAMFCVAMRRNVFEDIGFLDEKFGIGMFEDDDYSNRIREKGLRVVCAEDAFVHHFGQAAFKQLIESGEYQKIWATNQAYYEEKWGKWKPHAHRN